MLQKPRSQRYPLFYSILGTLLLSSIGLAAPNDIYLLGLVDKETGAPDQEAFARFTTELGLVATPSPLQPAETTGQAGFDFGVDMTLHSISVWEDYWKDGRVGTALEGREPFIPTLQTVGVRGRKGFIFPVPLTSELELGANWIMESSMLTVGGNLKVALNEGFRWIPDLAVMIGVNRLVGAEALDLTTATAGGSISKGFGFFGDVNLCPFISYQSVFINASSRILDPDPTNTNDVGNTFTFETIPMVRANNNNASQCAADFVNCLDMNRFDRLSLGLRGNVSIVQISGGVDLNYLPRNVQFPVMVQAALRFGLLF